MRLLEKGAFTKEDLVTNSDEFKRNLDEEDDEDLDEDDEGDDDEENDEDEDGENASDNELVFDIMK